MFHDQKLIANLTTSADTPEATYEIDGVVYEVKSFTGPVLESDGGEGWDVQVEPA